MARAKPFTSKQKERLLRKGVPTDALASAIRNKRALPYAKKWQLLPMGRAARMNAAQRARDFSYSLPADVPVKVRRHVEEREVVARAFLHQQLMNPTMTRALFNSYYSGLRKTITEELRERGYNAGGPRYNRYEPIQKQWGGSKMLEYAMPEPVTGRSALYWHERGHLLIGKAIFADPVNFKLEEVYPKVLAELEKEKAAEAGKRKQPK